MIVVPFVFNFIYLFLLAAVSPALVYQRWKHGKYRDGWAQKLWGRVPLRSSDGSKCIWLHAVSVGEVLQLRQVIKELRNQSDHLTLLISTTTQTGYQVAQEKFPDCEVTYFPLDFSWSVKNALRRVKPDLIVLVELELWPNFIGQAWRQEIPVVLINGRLSEKSFRGYRKLKFFFSKLLNKLDHIAVQSEEYRQRFLNLGSSEESISVTGSIKFDGVQTDRNRAPVASLREFFQISKDEPVFIAGSTQAPEEEMALKAYENVLKVHPTTRLIIVPRHPERGEAISKLISDCGYAQIRRSTGLETKGNLIPVGLLDTVGELNDCWALADVAFVGGSFGDRGGQNMLEPAAYGAAVCFGPNTRNFRQIVDLLKTREAAFTVNDQRELDDFVLSMILNRSNAEKTGQRAKDLVLSHQGATQETVRLIYSILFDSKHEFQQLKNVA